MIRIAWVAHVNDDVQTGITDFTTLGAAREYERLLKEGYGESLVSTKLLHDGAKEKK